MAHNAHYTCEKQLKEFGGNAECCYCIGHYCGDNEVADEDPNHTTDVKP